ncbi:MAG: efflux RND transporter permease subunit, partial [Burkholderiales bacterium]|nr:efflux RND transporter permease subunit [Burkholderiales bacterium]
MRSKVFIDRPIFASVISIIIVLCGLVAMFNMPVAQYPNISPPTIAVQASYPGASAETIERTVAAQLEAQLNGVANVIYMNSNSTSSGSVSIKLTFEIGTDLNYAVNDVLNRVHAAMPLLPSVVQLSGVNVRKSSPDQLLTIAFMNNGKGTFNLNYMSNYLYRTVYNDLNRVSGVGQISFYGKYYAMRVWLNVNAMNSLNVTPNDISNAIKDQSNEYKVGASNGMPVESTCLTFNVAGSSMYNNPQQFENIIIRQTATQVIKLKDVARVELGAYRYNVIPQSTYIESGEIKTAEIAMMQVYMNPSGNQLEVKQRVLKLLHDDAVN